MIEKREFAEAALNPEDKTFVIHVVVLTREDLDDMHPSKKAQIAYWKADKTFTEISNKYNDFGNVFFLKLAAELLEHFVNNYAIKLVNNKQPSFGSIYNLRSVKLKTLKTYIENNLASSFIRPFKSLTAAPILFDQKLNRSLWLCVNY